MPVSTPHHRLYWPLQLGGWFAYGAVGFVINATFDTGVPPAKVAALASSGSVLLLVSTHLFRAYARRNKWTGLTFAPLILRLLAGTFVISAASQLLLSLLMIWPIDVITLERPYSVRILVIYIFQTQIILLLWSFIYFSFHAIRNYKREEIEKWRLHAAATDAELIALKSQIHPHFIFNCLNNIRALVLEDAQRAREAITRLSDLLRYSLQYAKAESVSVEQEIAVVTDYLALESIHMEQRLVYRLDISPDTLSLRIPPMVIQLLAENAIKHGLAQLPSGGELRIKAALRDSALQISVTNTGKFSPKTSSTTGIGLPNLRERLALLYGPDAQLVIEQLTPTEVGATLTIPDPSSTERTALSANLPAISL